MACLRLSTKHAELQRSTCVLVDDDDNPISEPELVSSCSCGAEVRTLRANSDGRRLSDGRFYHDVVFDLHKTSTIAVRIM